jgi:serine/threonine protein kinase
MAIPEKIGKYKITRELGKGAMGMVYEGMDPVIERRVAIKTILAEYLEQAESEDAVARFKREAQASGRLNHPGVVAVYEYGEESGMSFIVLEYVEGKELKELLKKGQKFEMVHIFEIMKQLLVALDYSHKQGVIHRDIKPANIMIMRGLKVKVMDFGIARIESSSLTQVGTVVGTPTHMAPEQLMGLPADGRVDLWASAVILYELLTGRSPFLAETPAQVMHGVLQGDPIPPTAINPDIPAAFDNFITKALAKKADDRFQNAKEFLTALLQTLQGKDFSATTAMRAFTEVEKTLTNAQAADLETMRSGPQATQVISNPGTRTMKAAAQLSIPADTLMKIESSLTKYLGPISKVAVREGLQSSRTIDDFFDALAEQIGDEEQRATFLSRVTPLKQTISQPGAAAPAPAATAKTATQPRAVFSPEVLSTAEKRLASYVGPLAKLLIKEAAGSTGTIRDLYTKLAANIDDAAERKAFLASFEQ